VVDNGTEVSSERSITERTKVNHVQNRMRSGSEAVSGNDPSVLFGCQ
jgi:hypothetical protein